MCLTGNEAIVRGALEAGIGFVSGYPGTPASEIGDIFRDVSAHFGIRYEDSVNEKVAVETAFAAALLGVRSLAAMKHLGLASAGDPAGTIPYIGTHGGFVIVSGGDPGLIVSPNEQDQRYAARMMQMPVFDPATPGHALEMTRFAFSFSEQTRLPVLIRTTIQVNFARGVVETRPLPGAPSRLPFEKNPGGHVPIPSNARRMRRELADRIRLAESLLTGSPLFTRTGSGPLGIVTSGVSVNYVLDAIEEMGLEDAVQVLHLGCVYPVPAEVMEGMFASCERLLVVEELLPFVEETLKSAAHEQGYTGRIDGKSSGHIPESFALDPDIVRAAVKDFVAGTTPSIAATNDEPAGANDPAASGELAPRPPVLCAGCSHRSAFLAVRMVLGEESIYCNDIGCYTLGYGAPLDSADMVLSMGSSIAMASSASRLGHQNPVAYIGDSTFFHSGLPALANAVRNEDNIIVVVMDNRIVAMTGHQSSFSERSPAGEPELSIADVCRSMGAKVWVANPDRLPDVVPLIERIADESGVRVLVTEETCPLDAFRKGTLKKEKVYRIDRTLCRHCGHEARSLYCATAVPRRYQETAALSRVRSMLPADDAAQPSAGAAASRAACGVLGAHDGAPCAQACPVGALPYRPYERHTIEDSLCTRCGMCLQVCQDDAVEVV